MPKSGTGDSFSFIAILILAGSNSFYDSLLCFAEVLGKEGAFLAEEYWRLKRNDEAMQLIWARFTERPFLANYQKLHLFSNKPGL